MKSKKQSSHSLETSHEGAVNQRSGGAGKMRVKVIGVGGAGCRAIDRLVSLSRELDLVVVNTDSQSLASSNAPEKIQIGGNLTRGLGAGGDAEMGKKAVVEDIERLRTLLRGVNLVFIVAGMGGGTGTGAAPVIARVARESGALVLALVTLPFGHEGQRRIEIAREGLKEMKSEADALIEISNDRLIDLADENTSVLEAFRPADEFLSNVVLQIWRVFNQPGMMNVDFGDLCAVLRRDGETLIGFGEGNGEQKVAQALESALNGPFLKGADSFTRAIHLLVVVTHGPEFPMRQLTALFESLKKQMGPKTFCKQGILVDENYKGKISILLLASTGVEKLASPSVPSVHREEKIIPPQGVEQKTLPVMNGGGGKKDGGKPAETKVSGAPPVPRITRPPSDQTHKQGILALDETARGVFDRVERTLVNGEDLDRPTFLRRGISIKRVV